MKEKAIVGVQQHQCVAAYNSSMCGCMLCTWALVRGKCRPDSAISSKNIEQEVRIKKYFKTIIKMDFHHL